MILLEVEPGLWVHASIDLPYTTRLSSTAEPRSTGSKEFHDALLPDAWLEESIRRAWRDWALLNGGPAHILSQKSGRAGLERSLEKYFSVWAWSWDLELATNADVVPPRNLFVECVEAFPVVARAPRSKLVRLMQSDAAQRIQRGQHGERELVILSDTAVLWPPTDAGCFDSEDEADQEDETNTARRKHTQTAEDGAFSQQGAGMDPETRAELLRRVVSHLTGLERERDLIRAASVSSTSDGRKRGTSGAIRERGSSSNSNQPLSKRDVRNGLLSASTNKKRVVSSPVMQQRSTSASSYASSTTESTRWSNWGSVFSGLGKLGFRGSGDGATKSEAGDASSVVDPPEPGGSGISIVTANLSGAGNSGRDVIPTTSSPIQAPAPERTEGVAGEAQTATSSPLQVLQPIQEAGGKMWSGAELAFRGIGASLGLANAPVPAAKDGLEADRTAAETGQEADVSERDRFADASFDTNRTGADADASVVTKVSILEPEVDVSELAEALGTDEEALDLSIPEPLGGPESPVEEGSSTHESKRDTAPVETQAEVHPTTAPTEAAESDPISPSTTEARGSDAASIRTSASAKAFPSISVTSAAWYNTKALRSDPSVTMRSPKLPSAAGIFSALDKADSSVDRGETFDVSLGGVSVQSSHHDFELDGWGYEAALPFQTFRCFVGESDVAISHESVAQLQGEPLECTEYRVSFTTRRLLTLVLIESVASTDGRVSGKREGELEEAWQLLRRLQRMLNDYDRQRQGKVEERGPVRFLHADGQTQTMQSSLETPGEAKLEDEVEVVASAHCVWAMELMRRHGVVETFARSSSGKTWTASRQGRPSTHARKGEPGTEEATTTTKRANTTFMVLAGKKMSIVDCDTELRKLANQYPSFGI